MNVQELASARPYLLRALHEWCTDNGLTPYIAVIVDYRVQVPMEYVNDGQIVLNTSFDATSHLHIGNDEVTFKARFGGVSRDIVIPMDRIMAIYARENGQGLAFPVHLEPTSESTENALTSASSSSNNKIDSSGQTSSSKEKTLQLVSSQKNKSAKKESLKDSLKALPKTAPQKDAKDAKSSTEQLTSLNEDPKQTSIKIKPKISKTTEKITEKTTKAANKASAKKPSAKAKTDSTDANSNQADSTSAKSSGSRPALKRIK